LLWNTRSNDGHIVQILTRLNGGKTLDFTLRILLIILLIGGGFFFPPLWIGAAIVAFRSWITGRRANFHERHMIPERIVLCDALFLPEFVREREKLIRMRLLGMPGQRAA
jgi:hypothetical protein